MLYFFVYVSNIASITRFTIDDFEKNRLHSRKNSMYFKSDLTIMWCIFKALNNEYMLRSKYPFSGKIYKRFGTRGIFLLSFIICDMITINLITYYYVGDNNNYIISNTIMIIILIIIMMMIIGIY